MPAQKRESAAYLIEELQLNKLNEPVQILLEGIFNQKMKSLNY